MRPIKNILIIAFLLCVNLLSSQSVYIGKWADIKSNSLDSVSNTMYVYFKDYYKKINLETFETDSVQMIVDPQFEFNYFQPLIINSKHYFVHTQGGIVYTLQNDSIKRIDNSFNHKMQISSNIFVYDSKIVRYGGYGFWSARNILTYFDTDLMEWEAINPINSKETLKGSFEGLYYLAKDEVYFFNGSSIDELNKTNQYFNKEVWKYNFKLKAWSSVGTSELKDINHFTIPLIYNKSLLVSNVNEITIIDPVNNKLSKFKHGKYFNKIVASLNFYYLNNRFYYFYFKDNNNIYMKSAIESELIGEMISEKPFYSNYNFIKGLFLVLTVTLLSAILMIFGFTQFKKRNKILVLDNGLRYKNKFTEFGNKAMRILKLLLSEPAVKSSEILCVVEEMQYSAAHNERLKVQKLEEINLKIKTLLGLQENIIKSKKSEKDKRIRMYFINKDLFFYNKKES